MKENDNETVYFEYPRKFDENSLVKEIRLEIGSLAAWTPLTTRKITPMIAEKYSGSLKIGSTDIRTVDAKRTFWEKATILHDIAHRSNVPPRYSRHYYDLFMLSRSDVKTAAFEDVDLLAKVSKFKIKFYHSNRARYDQATVDSIELIPPDDIQLQLQKDYNSMKSMIYGSVVGFDTIIEGLEDLLSEIRKLERQ